MSDECSLHRKDQQLVGVLKPPQEPAVLEPDLLADGERIVWQNKILVFVRRDGDVEHHGAGMLHFTYVFTNLMDDYSPEYRLTASEVRAGRLLGTVPS